MRNGAGMYGALFGEPTFPRSRYADVLSKWRGWWKRGRNAAAASVTEQRLPA